MPLEKNTPAEGKVLSFFEQISKIPRRSFLTAPIADYLCDFARARGLWFYRDGADNVIIKKDASRGAEKRNAVILQAHTDMVLVTKDASVEQDRGVKLLKKGDFLIAEGTSLGGDDGIGMAYILAILDDKDLVHPPIEAVFTSNEEVGLLGAAALDCSALSGRMLINLDSDTEGIFTVGCAGGSGARLSLPLKRPIEEKGYTLTLLGLPGGHSGTEIAKGIKNASLLLVAFLKELCEKAPLRLAALSGGEASNAIPTFATASFFSSLTFDKLNEICKQYFTKDAFGCEGARFSLERTDALFCADEEKSRATIEHILSLPNGVLAMEKDLIATPETSLNLGIIKTEKEALSLSYSLRSSKNEKRAALEKKLESDALRFGGTAHLDGAYPAWEFKECSALRDACLKAYREAYGSEAAVEVIHAGLECGIFADKIPGLDAVSFGPTNMDIHTVDERLSLSSAARTFRLLLGILKTLTE